MRVAKLGRKFYKMSSTHTFSNVLGGPERQFDQTFMCFFISITHTQILGDAGFVVALQRVREANNSK